MSANLNIVRERINAFNFALSQGAPVVKIPEHSYRRPKRNFKPYGGGRELWNSTEPRVILHGPAESGKTLAVLHLLDHLCWSYPNLQCAIVRKVAADMPSSVLQSYQKKVLRMEDGKSKTEDGVTKYGGEHPEFFSYPNGSRVWVAGLDRPGKVLSSEKDVIVVNQAEELSQDDWETLSTRTTGRAGVLKPARLIGDCNPGPSTHWIPALASQGSLRMIQSNHRDNPTLFDPKTGEITEQGRTSIASLEALTGVRRKRLLEGKWVAAEGIVYETFDKTYHMRATPIQDIQYHIAGVDWGLKNPGVIGVWGVDGDGRMYRVWEVYRTQKLVAASQPEDAWWINVAIELRNFFKIQMFVCDPSRPDHISAFQKAGLPAIGAFNDKSLGIQNIESRLAIQPDGFPRLFLLYNSKAAPDPLLVKEHKPTCLEEEIEVYSWAKDAAGKPIKEEPVDENNHALDACRYICAYQDKLGPDRRLIYA